MTLPIDAQYLAKLQLVVHSLDYLVAYFEHPVGQG